MDWRALEAATDAIVVRAFAEPVRLSFMKNGSPDPARPLQNIDAVVHHPNADGAVSIGNGMITTLSTSGAALVIERAEYPDIVLKTGDRVRASSATGSYAWYEVANVSDRFSSILVAELNEA
jgi:hypothetical protein